MSGSDETKKPGEGQPAELLFDIQLNNPVFTLRQLRPRSLLRIILPFFAPKEVRRCPSLCTKRRCQPFSKR